MPVQNLIYSNVDYKFICEINNPSTQETLVVKEENMGLECGFPASGDCYPRVNGIPGQDPMHLKPGMSTVEMRSIRSGAGVMALKFTNYDDATDAQIISCAAIIQ